MKFQNILFNGFLLVVLLLGTAGAGELYKWVDDQGKTHYGDKPPQDVNLKEIKGTITSFTSVNVEPFVFDSKLIKSHSKAKTVIMYSTNWCGYCKQAAKHFRKNNIAFTEYDIEKSAKAAKEYKQLGGKGVPVILIGNQRMNGFRASSFDKIYYAKN